MLVKVERITAGVGVVNPEVMIAGNERLGTGESSEDFEAFMEVVSRSLIPAQQEKIGRLILEKVDQAARRLVAQAVVAPMQVGGDGNAHGDPGKEKLVDAGRLQSFILQTPGRRKNTSPRGFPRGLAGEQ